MKFAVMADIHSNLVALEAVLDKLGDLPILNCGDLVGYNPWPNEVVEMAPERKMISIQGNHDYAVITGDTSGFSSMAARAIDWTMGTLTPENLAYLQGLPVTKTTHDLYMVHGSPLRPLKEYVYEDRSSGDFQEFLHAAARDILIMGHTHCPFVKKVHGNLVLNPGSVGQPRDGNPRASYAILDTEDMTAEIKRVDYDIHRVAKTIRKEGLPSILAERLQRGW